MKTLKYLSFILLVLVVACEEEPVEVVFADLGKRSGVFISCEGNFMYGNASLSFYDKVNKKVYNQVFYARNRAPLGDVAQSLASDGKKLYVVVNNSGKIYVLDPVTLEYRGAVTGLVSPRYIHFVSAEKAYVSDLYARQITIFNPQNLQKTGVIDVSDGSDNSSRHPTETFVQAGKWLFVSCWSYDNTLLVIDPEKDMVVDSVKVPKQPQKMVLDKNGKIWVLTDGSYKGAPGGYENPALVRIDPETRTVEQIFRWSQEARHPGDLDINPARDTLLVVAGGFYKMGVDDSRLPAAPFIAAGNRLFFSAGVDPQSGEIYLADAVDYAQNAMVYRFSPGGAVIDSFRVGISPGDYLFN